MTVSSTAIILTFCLAESNYFNYSIRARASVNDALAFRLLLHCYETLHFSPDGTLRYLDAAERSVFFFDYCVSVFDISSHLLTMGHFLFHRLLAGLLVHDHHLFLIFLLLLLENPGKVVHQPSTH